ncbi:MAG: RNA methyltransferase [Planctomycetaceae bacterium]|nr:RNA methyltransferase [Planctomycetaceae bacterium]
MSHSKSSPSSALQSQVLEQARDLFGADTEQVALFEHELGMLTRRRLPRLHEAVQQRTRRVVAVMEDIYSDHNQSAVMRSCDAFGIQDVHLIEDLNEFDVARTISRGAHKWLTLQRYSGNTARPDCVAELRTRGYKLVVTSPHEGDFTPQTLPLDAPVALVFGNEHQGVTATLMEEADAFVQIPMYGFSESLNISVATAIVLQQLAHRLRSENHDWSLTEREQMLLLVEWVGRSIPHREHVERRFLKELRSRNPR